ncbi:hypothetical protein [Clostridium sp. ZS2-4]|nr:hypothetical protein [Clostridium sp. ZS2-4]MCY6355624.1 hypothetical protein [Clostridium sp. ZS2-4]
MVGAATMSAVAGDGALALMLRGIFYDKDGKPKANKVKQISA